MCTPSNQIFYKQNEILKQLKKLKPIEVYRHLDTNLQEMFAISDEKSNKSDQIFEKQQ